MAYYDKYKSPADLMLDQSLSDGEKNNLLEQWRYDEENLLRATEEGMLGNGRQNILRQVNKALLSLNKTSSR